MHTPVSSMSHVSGQSLAVTELQDWAYWQISVVDLLFTILIFLSVLRIKCSIFAACNLVYFTTVYYNHLYLPVMVA